MVPVQLLRSPEISSHAVRVFLLLDSYATWSTLEAFPAHARLAADMGVSVPTVRRAIKEVVDAGYVVAQARTDPRGLRIGTIYTLLDGPQLPDGTSLGGGTADVNSGVITGDQAACSQVIARRDHPWHPINTSPEINTDNNSAPACVREEADAATVVVSSAAPPEGPTDTPLAGVHDEADDQAESAAPSLPAGADGEERRGAAQGVDIELLSNLLASIPGLLRGTAEEWIATHGAPRVREVLAWLEAEMAAKAVPSPAGWLSQALTTPWTQPPKAYRDRQEREESARQRADTAAAAERERQAREAQRAERSAQIRSAAEWFGALAQTEQFRVDADIRAALAPMLVVQAAGLPPLAEVLTDHGLAASLWRDRLVSIYAGSPAVPAPVPDHGAPTAGTPAGGMTAIPSHVHAAALTSPPPGGKLSGPLPVATAGVEALGPLLAHLAAAVVPCDRKNREEAILWESPKRISSRFRMAF